MIAKTLDVQWFYSTGELDRWLISSYHREGIPVISDKLSISTFRLQLRKSEIFYITLDQIREILEA
ncbi:MAG: hypothetical protein EOM02_08280 [Synergistales bacterium]|nr:hypothetical protein [Synergistales bacterium]